MKTIRREVTGTWVETARVMDGFDADAHDLDGLTEITVRFAHDTHDATPWVENATVHMWDNPDHTVGEWNR